VDEKNFGRQRPTGGRFAPFRRTVWVRGDVDIRRYRREMPHRALPASGGSALPAARLTVVPGQLDLLDALERGDVIVDDDVNDGADESEDFGDFGDFGDFEDSDEAAPVVGPVAEVVTTTGEASSEPVIEVRRSTRRRRTVSAYRDGDRTVVLIPARLTKKQEREWVAAMVEQLDERDRRTRPGDEELMERAEELSGRYLGGHAVPASVRWVSNQREQWGSCTPADRTIRLSDRLLGMPTWVVDYVLLHELAHLIVPSHGPDFWALLKGYTRLERARGFLEGLTAAARTS